MRNVADNRFDINKISDSQWKVYCKTVFPKKTELAVIMLLFLIRVTVYVKCEQRCYK